MGIHGDEVAAELGVTREEQDAWALRSQQRYANALAAGKLAAEVIAVAAPSGEVGADEQPRPDTSAARLAALRPVFSENGTITRAAPRGSTTAPPPCC